MVSIDIDESENCRGRDTRFENFDAGISIHRSNEAGRLRICFVFMDAACLHRWTGEIRRRTYACLGEATKASICAAPTLGSRLRDGGAMGAGLQYGRDDFGGVRQIRK